MTTSVATACPYCGVGCGILATRRGGRVEVAGDPRHPSNRGLLCSKGTTLGETLGTEGRLLHPTIRGARASWDEALDAVSSRMAAVAAEHGPEAIAFYVSGQLLTEDYYVANKLMKGFLGSANIDTNSRLCMSSTVAAQQRAFGEDVVPGCYEDLELADLVVLVGSNTAWCHPVLFRRLLDARRRRPSMRIVAIDPRRTVTCEAADVHLALKAGSDVWLFAGLLAHLATEGQVNEAFVRRHTAGASEALAVAQDRCGDPRVVAEACGLSIEDLLAFYREFASTENVVTAWSQGANQSTSGTDKVTSILNCHLATGRIGRPGMGPLSLTGQPNAMGGREVGGMATMLAAHRHLDSETDRRAVQAFWSAPRMASTPGLKAVDLFDAVEAGRIRALWIMATNPAVSLPDADRVRRAIAGCEFVVVSDCVARTDTTAVADVLLPAAGWGEKDGTATNSERTIVRQRAFVDPPGEARPDWWIVTQVARRLGFGAAFPYETPHEIFDEHARLSTLPASPRPLFDLGGLAGRTREEYDALEPVQWPLRDRAASGTARLFGDGRFAFPDGRARLVPTPPQTPAHATSARFPFVLNTGRVRDQWHTRTRTGNVACLCEHLAEPFVEMHAQDAAHASLGDGELVRVTTAWGSMVAPLKTSRETPRSMVFAPIHWSDANAAQARAGAMVNPAVDPVSGEPEFKHTPAAVERLPTAWRGFVLSRQALPPPDAAWWAQTRGDGYHRCEMAGTVVPPDWDEWTRKLLGANGDQADLVVYRDSATGNVRAALFHEDRLSACVFVGPAPPNVDRAWLGEWFSASHIDSRQRRMLLAGSPLESGDTSPVVCACLRVRRGAIEAAVREEGLRTPAEIGVRLGAGTGCGSCLPEIAGLLANAMAAVAPRLPLEAPHPPRTDSGTRNSKTLSSRTPARAA